MDDLFVVNKKIEKRNKQKSKNVIKILSYNAWTKKKLPLILDMQASFFTAASIVQGRGYQKFATFLDDCKCQKSEAIQKLIYFGTKVESELLKDSQSKSRVTKLKNRELTGKNFNYLSKEK